MAENCRPNPNRRQPLILNHPLGEVAEPPMTDRALSVEVEVTAHRAYRHGLLATFGNISNISATNSTFFTCFSAFLDELTSRNSREKTTLWPLLHHANATTCTASSQQHWYRDRINFFQAVAQISCKEWHILFSYFLFAHTNATVQITWLQRGQLLYFLENWSRTGKY